MWDHVHLPLSLPAAVEACNIGSAIYVTDGSYMRTIDPFIDGAGWLIYCTAWRRIVLKGSMHERSPSGSFGDSFMDPSNRRIPQLIPPGARGRVACDNLKALRRSQRRRKKISPRSKQADILRVFRTFQHRFQGSIQYKHVYGHQDNTRAWHQLSLLEKLNCKCDSLAKADVLAGLRLPPPDTADRARCYLWNLPQPFITGESSLASAEMTSKWADRTLDASISQNSDGPVRLSIVWIEQHATKHYTTSPTCFEAG